jgi:hypothetical protein
MTLALPLAEYRSSKTSKEIAPLSTLELSFVRKYVLAYDEF